MSSLNVQQQLKKQQKVKKKSKDDGKCVNGVNMSPQASLLPPFNTDRKVVTLSGETLSQSTHVVTVMPKSHARVCT